MKLKLVPSLKLSQKLPLALIGSAIVVAAGVGIGSYVLASGALEGPRSRYPRSIQTVRQPAAAPASTSRQRSPIRKLRAGSAP